MISVKSFKAIEVAARKAEKSFKITTFTAHVDSQQIFKSGIFAFEHWDFGSGLSMEGISC